jgi:hypothetical protein
MGVNAQTAVPAFTAGQVLTAAQMTQVNTGIPVFATTVTRDAAFGGSGEKVLAQGQYAYIEATSTLQVYSGSAWLPAGDGLTYITQATPSAVNTVSINNCFTSTYTNYRIIANFTAAVGDASLTARLRVSGSDATTNYSSQRVFGAVSTAGASQNQAGTDEFYIADITGSTVTNNYISFELSSPALAQATSGMSIGGKSDVVQIVAIGHSTATAYDGITFLFGGTSVTGTIRVYGYQNS